MKNVLITGGSGLVGIRLTKMLVKKGYRVTHLTRIKNSKAGVRTYEWDARNGKLEEGALNGVNIVIHLAGAGIADKKWTDARKELIIKSRTQTAGFLLEKIKEAGNQLDCMVSASGINYYGAVNSDHINVEGDPAGEDFTADCVTKWEGAVDEFASLPTRVVKLRIGVVLALESGALPRLAGPVKMGFGAAVGSGKQWIPWVHVDDVCRMFIHAIETQSMEGVYNAISPEHINNADLTKAIAKQLKRPLWMPKVPAWALKMMYGEMADLVLQGSRASCEKLQQTGFEHSYPDVVSALKHLYRPKGT